MRPPLCEEGAQNDPVFQTHNLGRRENPLRNMHLLSLVNSNIHYSTPDGDCQAFFNSEYVPEGKFCQEYQTEPPILAGLILTEGPMVVVTAQDLIYWPLAAAGFALMIAPIRASKFSWILSVPKETLPMGQ